MEGREQEKEKSQIKTLLVRSKVPNLAHKILTLHSISELHVNLSYTCR